MSALVSVIVPMYNSETYILETLEALVEQSYEKIEIIVIDDHSTDRSVDIVRERRQRSDKIKLIELKENSGGPGRPRNIGLRACKGDIIAFCDSDDIWPFNFVEKALGVLEINEVRAICGVAVDFRGHKPVKLPLSGPGTPPQIINYFQLIFKDIAPLSSFMIRRSEINYVSFPEDRRWAGIEDYLMKLAYLKARGVIAKQTDLYFHYRRHNSLSASKVKQLIRVIRIQHEALLKSYGLLGLSLLPVAFAYYVAYSAIMRWWVGRL